MPSRTPRYSLSSCAGSPGQGEVNDGAHDEVLVPIGPASRRGAGPPRRGRPARTRPRASSRRSGRSADARRRALEEVAELARHRQRGEVVRPARADVGEDAVAALDQRRFVSVQASRRASASTTSASAPRSTSAVSSAWRLKRSSRSAARAIACQRFSRGSVAIRSRSQCRLSRPPTRKCRLATSSIVRSVAPATPTMSSAAKWSLRLAMRRARSSGTPRSVSSATCARAHRALGVQHARQ